MHLKSIKEIKQSPRENETHLNNFEIKCVIILYGRHQIGAYYLQQLAKAHGRNARSPQLGMEVLHSGHPYLIKKQVPHDMGNISQCGGIFKLLR